MKTNEKRTIAIGDIHGCYYTLIDLLQKIDYQSGRDTLIFLGDYIDRGPHSYQVVSQLKRLREQVGDSCICLRGNHEQMAIDNHGIADYIWAFNGGQHTVKDFSDHGAEIPTGWFRSLPLYYQTERFIFCHAGLTYPILQDNSEDDLLWGRSWLDIDRRPREKRVIFGHTPCETPYFAMTGDIDIDCGCVFGGKLCAIIIPENGEFNFEMVSKSPKDMEDEL